MSAPPALPELPRVRSLDQEVRCERLNSVATCALTLPLFDVGEMFAELGDWLNVAMVGLPALGFLIGVLIRERTVLPMPGSLRRIRKWRRLT